MKFEPMHVRSLYVDNQTILRRIFDGSISRSSAWVVADALQRGEYTDVDVCIDQMGLMQMVNSRRCLELVDKLAEEKNPLFMEAMRTGLHGAFIRHVMRETKGNCTPPVVDTYLNMMRDQGEAI